MHRIQLTSVLLVFASLASLKTLRADEQQLFFESKIRPVLIEHCYKCHSGDSENIGGGLLIDSRDGILSGGQSGPVLLSGRPDESLIIQALRYEDLEMPPDAPLPEKVINDFVKWISLGASDPRMIEVPPKTFGNSENEALWSFHPRQVLSLPPVKDSSWPRDAMDQFVLSRLEETGLTPTHDADPRSLLRRLYYDLIGLPPTLEQVETFVPDYQRNASTAIVSVVDSLLASPQFGVRWGRHWLDVARFGESNGDDGLGRNATFPHAWRYRDYVVDAFNKDLPYDRFLTEQIAGDLLPAETAQQRNQQLTATGFLAISSKPAAAMNSDFAMDVVDDQINVVCTAVLGLSVACARCHDHKHDPIPTRDYYALAGIFSSTETLYGAAGNEKLTAPPTPLHELHSTFTSQEPRPDRSSPPKFPANYSQEIDALEPVLHEKLDIAPERLLVQPHARYTENEFALLKDTTITGSFGAAADSYSVAFWFRNLAKNNAKPITAYLFSRAALENKELPGDHLGIGGNHDSERTGKLFVFNGNSSKKSIAGTTVIAPQSWNHIVFVRQGKQTKVFLNGQLEIEGELPPTFGNSLEFSLAIRSDKFAPLEGNLAEFSLFARAISDEDALHLHSASGQPRGVRPSPAQGYAMGVREKAKPADSKVHINGLGSKLGDSVPRGMLSAYRSVIGDENSTSDEFRIHEKSSGRLELTQWVTRADHPQTARVMVNRVWLHLFGQGIVATPDDFGVYGSRPSHPELLDHLAERFVQDGWSIKKLIRAIVLSRTYQLSSQCDLQLQSADPDNRLLARHSRRRLDAESLRDSMLQVCGNIDYAPQLGSAIDKKDQLISWPPGEATDLHRESNHRSLYLCRLRHAPPKELAAFDLPTGVEVMGNRDRTTLPTQALFLLNSDFVIRQAQHLAERVHLLPLDDEERVKLLISVTLQRHSGAAEIARSLAYIRSTDEALADEITEPSQRHLRVWASYSQGLLATNEFRYVD